MENRLLLVLGSCVAIIISGLIMLKAIVETVTKPVRSRRTRSESERVPFVKQDLGA